MGAHVRIFFFAYFLLLTKWCSTQEDENTTGTLLPTTAESPGKEVDHPPPLTDFLKFRVCSAAATGELFRFNLQQRCPETAGKTHTEGILLVYKRNIVPYIFKVRKYRKIATSVTVYRGWSDSAITGKDEMFQSVPLYELKNWDSIYQCYNAMRFIIDGTSHLYVDRDDVNKTVNLQPVDGLTGTLQRYFSQPVLYTEPGGFPGFYRVRTTVNCEMVDMIARSVEPYDHFITALGDTVEISPFCHNESSCSTTPKSATKGLTSQVVHNYTIVNYADRGSAPSKTTRVFVDNGVYSMSWTAEDKKIAVCSYKLWKGFTKAIQTAHESSFHFVANEVTATFTTPLTEVQNFTGMFPCLTTEINQTLTQHLAKVQDSYSVNGSAQYYKTEGGLYLVWQPLVHKDLDEATENKTMTTAAPTTGKPRRRREAPEGSAADGGLNTAQLQFAYDKLKTSVNQVLEELSRAWCREQQRDNLMWYELSKINPTSVMTAIYGRPVSARFVGDALAVTECIEVDQSSINVHKSLKTTNEGTCYARPQVTFKFVNGSTLFTGQLGARNEILLSTNSLEPCSPGKEHYFTAGNVTYYYKDHQFVKEMKTQDIHTLDTFLALNLTFIQNIDFKVIELYNSRERKLANTIDIETMFREYNYFTQKLTGLREDLDDVIDLNRERLIRDISGMMADLGSIGRGVFNVVSTVVSVFGSVVSGFISFFTNPLGGILIILVIIGVIFLVFNLRRRSAAIAAAPVSMFYPNIDNMSRSGSVQPMDQERIKQILLGMHQLQQEEAQAAAVATPRFSPWVKLKDLVTQTRGYQKVPVEEKGDLSESSL
ncbi:BALF4-like glycoprotein [Saguinine gammaherpesvirus 1]|uniref:BALF4-like glycoprotein n=1 Tax=Saguinine gammaherpesvirus 1 TaxID=2169901 RepID=A0A9Q8VIL5_9GAMA|nr:BALF4-like glycoprotein [Saguinine gammaherpesvirus 1]